MAGISFGGVGSGLDIAGIVNQLVAAERSGADARINRTLAQSNAQISALGNFRSAASALQRQMTELGKTGLTQFAATVQADAPFTATASDKALPGRYAVTVQQQASAQSLRSGAFGSADTVVGTGTLRIGVGDKHFEIELTDGDNALSSIAGAINRAADNTGVSARVVTADGGAHLILSSRNAGTGQTISVEPIGGDGGLEAVRFTGSAGDGLTQIQAAKDAIIEIDGLTVTRGSNSFDDVLPGVSLRVTDQKPGTAFTVDVQADLDKTVSRLSALVSAYNATMGIARDVTRYDAATGRAGALQGDATLRGASSALRTVVSAEVSGNPLGVLSAIGFTTATNGNLSLDDSTLRAALVDNPNAVEQLLTGAGGLGERMTAVLDGYLASDGRLAAKQGGLEARIKTANNDQAQLNRRMDRVREGLERQFNALDTLVGQMSSTSDFLSAQLARLL